jgi:16S rRNA (uracil1498-N3)-methyltransferase
VSADELMGSTVNFSASNARYLHRVLRLRRGDLVKAFDGGSEYLVELIEVNRAEVKGRLLEEKPAGGEDEMDIVLGFACVRPGPVEEILRHCTELGVRRFVPIISARANRRPENPKQRWRTVIASATGQSGRTVLPDVESPVSLADFLQEFAEASTGILLSTSPGDRPLLVILEREQPARVVLLVGPEGGLEDSEEVQAVEKGFLRASLGPAVLRTETAAVAATGLVAAWHQSRTWATGSSQASETSPDES